jgi:type IV secretion system protein VirD4
MSGHYRRGEEHGSSRWASPEEMREFADASDPRANIILSRNVSLALSRADHDPRLERNRNVLVVGGSGSGKTRSYVIPNLLQCNSSYIVTDPKGTLAGEVGPVLEAHGFEVHVLNTVDFSASERYNPLDPAYVRTQQDVLEVVDCIISNTNRTKESTADPFWENAERLLYSSLIAYLVWHCPEEDRNLPGLMTLLSLAQASEDDEGFQSPLDILFRELETGTRCVVERAGAARGREFASGGTVRWVRVADPLTPEQDFALGRYRAFRVAAGKTLKSIIISCNARLAPLGSDELKGLLSADDLALDRIGDEGRRVAIFATTSDTNGTYSFVLALLAWQTLNLLCERALRAYGGALPTPVHLVLDEFANIGRLPDFERSIAVVRSRNIGVSVILQSLSQLKARYGDNAQTIVDCCDTTLFLGGKSSETNRGISEQVGKQTVAVTSSSETHGQSPGSSRSVQVAERDLIQPSEVARLDRRKAIVLIAGANPVIDDKYDPSRHPAWREEAIPM